MYDGNTQHEAVEMTFYLSICVVKHLSADLVDFGVMFVRPYSVLAIWVLEQTNYERKYQAVTNLLIDKRGSTPVYEKSDNSYSDLQTRV